MSVSLQELSGPPVEGLPIATRVADVGGSEVELRETSDFPFGDPWSVLLRKRLGEIAEAGDFDGSTVIEAGIGDGRNALAAGIWDTDRSITYVGVDVDGWRLDLARENFETVGVADEDALLLEGDVIEWLKLSEGPLTGWGIACLPQAPEGKETTSRADGYDPRTPSLAQVRDLALDNRPVDDYGLTLNAAFLQTLREKVQEDSFDLLITLSDRVPAHVLEEFFQTTGWQLTEEHNPGNDTFVQQDPDTSVEYVQGFDDGQRFYEQTEEGYQPITAEEAEARRRWSLESSVDAEAARANLNVYHGLNVFHLVPITTARSDS